MTGYNQAPVLVFPVPMASAPTCKPDPKSSQIMVEQKNASTPRSQNIEPIGVSEFYLARARVGLKQQGELKEDGQMKTRDWSGMVGLTRLLRLDPR